jgi:hypothetical protein
VFLDPPYHKGLVTTTVMQLLAAGLLAPGAFLYIESEQAWEALELPATIQQRKATKAGLVNAFLARHANRRRRHESTPSLQDCLPVRSGRPGGCGMPMPRPFIRHFSVAHRCWRQREELLLPDGDFLDLDWHVPEAWTDAAPIVLVVHGLSGSSDSHYVLGLQAERWQCGAGPASP